MDKSEEEFLEKLKATFKLEAAEHIQTISSGLLDLDKGPDPEETALILETIYREAHSLKGAARAVSLRDVEKICQSMETVLILIEKGRHPTRNMDTRQCSRFCRGCIKTGVVRRGFTDRRFAPKTCQHKFRN